MEIEVRFSFCSGNVLDRQHRCDMRSEKINFCDENLLFLSKLTFIGYIKLYDSVDGDLLFFIYYYMLVKSLQDKKHALKEYKFTNSDLALFMRALSNSSHFYTQFMNFKSKKNVFWFFL